MLQHALQEFGKDDERYLQKRRAVEEKSRGAVGDGLVKPLLADVSGARASDRAS